MKKLLSILAPVVALVLILSPRKTKYPSIVKEKEESQEYSKQVHRYYLERRKYLEQSGDSVQRDLDQSLLNISVGALGLSIAFLQFSSLPVSHLSDLLKSWIFLGAAIFLSILSMHMSRSRFEYYITKEDEDENNRQKGDIQQNESDTIEGPKTGESKGDKTKSYDFKSLWIWFMNKISWSHSEAAITLTNVLISFSLLLGLIHISVFVWQNTVQKNKIAVAINNAHSIKQKFEITDKIESLETDISKIRLQTEENFNKILEIAKGQNMTDKEKKKIDIDENKGLKPTPKPVPPPKPNPNPPSPPKPDKETNNQDKN